MVTPELKIKKLGMVTPYFSARCRQIKCNANWRIPAPRKILENQTFEKFDFWNQTSGKFPNYLSESKIKPLDPVWAIYSNIYPKQGLIGLIIMDHGSARKSAL